MDKWQAFHFLRPWWLAALLPLLFAIYLLWRRRRSSNAWRGVCDEHLLGHLLVHRSAGRRPLALYLLLFAWLLAVLALAGPVWDRYPQPVYQSLAARVIVLDLSKSMDAADLQPSRLVRARFKIADILKQGGDGQTGLVVFAGAAFVVVPLTQDSGTIAALLPALESDIMPLAGSRVDLALNKAVELLLQAGHKKGQIILLSDASPDARAMASAEAAHAAGFQLSVLGVGTQAGAPIPAGGAELLKDAAGNIIIARLDNSALQALALAGGGRYSPLQVDSTDIAALLETELNALDDAIQRTGQQAESWREQGPWLILLLLPLAALAFRRGWLVLLAVFIAAPAQHASAYDWADLWWRRDQQAERALRAGAAGEALQLADKPWQRGTAAYRAGDYAGAAEAFKQMPGALGQYNYANALARQGRYEEAIGAYDNALAQDPGLEDARFNRALVIKQLAQKNEQRQQQNRRTAQQRDQGARQSGQNENEQNPREQQSKRDSHSSGDSQGQPDQAQSGQSRQEQAQAGSEEKNTGEQPGEQPQSRPSEAEIRDAEQQQVLEQWLRRIPDDPRGLLRRKFLLQYRRLAEQQGLQPEAQTW